MAMRRFVGHQETGARQWVNFKCWRDFVERKERPRSGKCANSVQKETLHAYLEQKAEMAVQGECVAQKRLSEAEAEMDIGNWEQRDAENALYETNRGLESQRLELYQANQWADQAQREKINLFGELEMRNRIFQENRARDCQDIEELRRIFFQEPERVRHQMWVSEFRLAITL